MDIALFEGLIDCHGGDLARWPTPERAEAEALLAASPPARAMLRDMQDVESVLRAPVAWAALCAIDLTAARAMRHRQQTRARRLAVRLGIGTAAAAVLALGVLVGGLLPSPGAHDMNADRVLAAALDSGGGGDVE